MMDLFIAVVIDWLIGDPSFFPHPVRLMGTLIAGEDKLVRKIAAKDEYLRIGGFFIVLVNIAAAFLIPWFLLRWLKTYPVAYHVVNVYMLYTCISARCLHHEAGKIEKALYKSIEEARYKLSFIVGRDTKQLDEQEITRAAVETVAENTSDGIIAPLLFAAVGGAPLAMVYKMVNTMDSMLGYMTPKYRYIGYFPAKTDDVFNFIPARLTGVLMNLSSIFRFDVACGMRTMFRDRKNHKSPNCAYPEGAVAGLLGIQLGGDNVYFGELVSKPKIGEPFRAIDAGDIKKTIEIMYKAEALFIILYLLIRIGAKI